MSQAFFLVRCCCRYLQSAYATVRFLIDVAFSGAALALMMLKLGYIAWPIHSFLLPISGQYTSAANQTASSTPKVKVEEVISKSLILTSYAEQKHWDNSNNNSVRILEATIRKALLYPLHREDLARTTYGNWSTLLPHGTRLKTSTLANLIHNTLTFLPFSLQLGYCF